MVLARFSSLRAQKLRVLWWWAARLKVKVSTQALAAASTSRVQEAQLYWFSKFFVFRK